MVMLICSWLRQVLGVATLGLPDSPGVPKSSTNNTLNAPYNDLEAVKAFICRKSRSDFGNNFRVGSGELWLYSS